jgi:uncharacterized membrane protein
MQHVLMIAISLHVLAAMFWAGSTFALASMAGNGSERLFVPQMVAALVAILFGGYLWRTLHQGTFETMEKVLGVGVACAFVALLVQLVVAGIALRNLRRQSGDAGSQRSRIAFAHRIAAVLLAVTTLTMAAARFA